MRLGYPLNDKPLFTYPAISVREYNWWQKAPSEKFIWRGFAVVWIFIFGYLVLASSAGHLITWNDLTPGAIWRIFVCMVTVALFPVIFMPVMKTFRSHYPGREAQSIFYSEWASAFAGNGKGGGGRIVFFAEDAERFQLKGGIFRETPVCVVTVSFRRKLFFRRGTARFVIRPETESRLDLMLSWARSHGIKVEDQRRS